MPATKRVRPHCRSCQYQTALAWGPGTMSDPQVALRVCDHSHFCICWREISGKLKMKQLISSFNLDLALACWLFYIELQTVLWESMAPWRPCYHTTQNTENTLGTCRMSAQDSRGLLTGALPAQCLDNIDLSLDIFRRSTDSGWRCWCKEGVSRGGQARAVCSRSTCNKLLF